jgi:hypothetical protein
MFEKKHCPSCGVERLFYMQLDKCCSCNKVLGKTDVLTQPCGNCYLKLPIHGVDICPKCDTPQDKYVVNGAERTLGEQAKVNVDRVITIYARHYDSCARYGQLMTATLLLKIVVKIQKAHERAPSHPFVSCGGEVCDLLAVKRRDREIMDGMRAWLRNMWASYEGTKAKALSDERAAKKQQLATLGAKLEKGERFGSALREYSLPEKWSGTADELRDLLLRAKIITTRKRDLTTAIKITKATVKAHRTEAQGSAAAAATQRGLQQNEVSDDSEAESESESDSDGLIE